MKHTDYPWVQNRPNDNSLIQITSSDGVPIAEIYETDDTEGNARLIQYSPQLLNDLKNMIWNFSGESGLSPVQKKAIEYAREAVSNATGETYAKGGTVSRFKNWLNERIW